MKKSNRQFILASLFSLFLGLVLWYWGQYVPCALGLLAGSLRIVLFNISREGERFQKHSGYAVSPARRTEVESEELKVEYGAYVAEVKKLEYWRKPLGFLALAVVVSLIVLLDRQMIFYTFLFSMLTTWIWFQGYLAWKVGK